MNTMIPLRKSNTSPTARAARCYAEKLARYPVLPRERNGEGGLGAKLRSTLARLGLRRARA